MQKDSVLVTERLTPAAAIPTTPTTSPASAATTATFSGEWPARRARVRSRNLPMAFATRAPRPLLRKDPLGQVLHLGGVALGGRMLLLLAAHLDRRTRRQVGDELLLGVRLALVLGGGLLERRPLLLRR